MGQSVTTLCRMCNDRCGLTVEIDGGDILAVSGTPGHPWNDGKLCAKGQAVDDFVNAPDRLRRPLKRVGSHWVEVDLETALDEIAQKMQSLKEVHGTRSVAVWKGEGIGFAQQEMLARRFCHAWGTPNYFSNDSTCFCSRWIASSLVYGTGLVPDFEHSRCITLWGSNPAHSHPFQFSKILAARKNGGQLIVIDPRSSEVSRSADLHLRPRLGTDGALAWGLIHVIVTSDLYDRDFVGQFTLGFEELRTYAARFSPAVVEAETGVPATAIIEAAQRMADAAPASLIYSGNGLEHHRAGNQTLRSIACIDALLGSVDRMGANRWADAFPLARLTLYHEFPLDDLEPIGARTYPLLYEFNQECHTLTGIDAMLTGKPYPLRGLIVTAANPVLSHPRSDKVVEALGSLDLLVVRDLFLTETAQLAHYVLPAASFLERSELHVDPTHNRVHLTKRVLSRPDSQDEYGFWRDLAGRLGIAEHFPWADEDELNDWLLQNTGLSRQQIGAEPTGYVYGSRRYEKWRHQLFRTRSGRVEFASSTLAERGFPRLPEYDPPSAPRPGPDYPLLLVSGSRQRLFVGSRYHNLPRVRRPFSGPEAELTAEDAARAGVTDGATIIVESRRGQVTVKAKVVKEGGPPGVIFVPFGWAQANINLLTPDDDNDPVTGFPALKEVPVRIALVSTGA